MKSHQQVLTPTDSNKPGLNLRWQVGCPTCGAEEVDRETGRDHESVMLHPDRDDYDSPIGTRGGYVQIDLTCAEGHEFALVIANHKGAEVVGVVLR